MHTIMMVGIGIVALAVFAVGGAVSGRSAAWGARWFLLPWLAVALVNFYIGTTRGYSAVTELGFFFVVFGLPAIAAWGITRLYGR
jgi:hypothetical protein